VADLEDTELSENLMAVLRGIGLNERVMKILRIIEHRAREMDDFPRVIQMATEHRAKLIVRGQVHDTLADAVEADAEIIVEIIVGEAADLITRMIIITHLPTQEVYVVTEI